MTTLIKSHEPDTLKMTAREWRDIDPDWKAIEGGRRYLLRQEEDGAHLISVEIIGSNHAPKAGPGPALRHPARPSRSPEAPAIGEAKSRD